MGTIIIVSILLMFVAVMMIIIGFLSDEYECIIPVGIVFAIIVGIYGFGVAGCVIPINTKTEYLIPDEVIRGKTAIFAKCNGQTFESSEHILFGVEDGKIRVKKVTDYNSYGCEAKNPKCTLVGDEVR